MKPQLRDCGSPGFSDSDSLVSIDVLRTARRLSEIDKEDHREASSRSPHADTRIEGQAWFRKQAGQHEDPIPLCFV